MTFAILMVAAAVLALLPASWTACSGGLTQPLGWLGWGLSSGTRHARQAASGTPELGPTLAEHSTLQSEYEELGRKLGHQQVEIAELERLVADLSGLRDQLGDVRAKLIFAVIVGGDSSPARETITISKGQRHGVQVGDWVAAGAPSAARAPGNTGRDLLLRQWLVGRVSEAQPHISRVQLASDPQFGVERAWPGKELDTGGWELADGQCGLEGLGAGQMGIRQASQDYLADGYTMVLVPLRHPRPMALVVGRIVASRALETGLHYELEVEPWGDAYELSHVYVISFSQ
jgi:cell shape-determining protein MreC